MLFEFTKRARRIIDSSAQSEAVRLNSETVDPEHILLCLIRDQESTAMKVLGRLGINFDALKRSIESRYQGRSIFFSGTIPLNPKFNMILENAKEEVAKHGTMAIGTEHLLLALFKDAKSAGISNLIEAGITYDMVKEETDKISVSKNESEPKKGKSSFPIAEYTFNLTERAEKGLLETVIGRNPEIERVIRILSRKTKNNPVLIGDAGVGKTAIVEGLARRIVSRQVPDSLQNKTILSFDIAAIVAGTKYRGEFEDRLKKIINEIKNSDNIILFIDELHTIMGAGAAEGAIDAANILKPFLARSEIQCIGATTLKEYRKYIEKDAALERRFQTVIVREPSESEAIEILSGLKESFENHHRVRYTDDAIKASVKLSSRYIRERFLPDKAIDILDEAGAKAKLDNSGKPEEILEIERLIDDKNGLKNELVEQQKYEEAAAVRDEIREIKKNLNSKLIHWLNKTNEYSITVDEKLIKNIIAQWTSIPVNDIDSESKDKLLNLEAEVTKLIIGQDDAVKTVSKSILRSKAGLRKQNRPMGIFLFSGPTGVGKTELAKVLARKVFGDDSALIRLDMSEYMEKHAVSRLVGAPPGYVGYEEGGQLTEKVRRKPYSVILFDEIEKAHPDFYNMLLQLFDEGELTDNIGTKVSFRDTLVIMTSNLGNSRFDKSPMGFAGKDENETSIEKTVEEVKRSFNPEFINRLDEIICFNRLTKENINRIVLLMLEEITAKLSERGISLKYDNKITDYIAEKGYSEQYGARFLRRIIQTEIEDPLSVELISENFIQGETIYISLGESSLLFSKTSPADPVTVQ